MPGPLDGIKIVDLTVALTGPLAVGILVDQGADAVKVERPTSGDPARYIGINHGGISAMFQVANRGKRGVVLDLSTTEGVELLLELAGRADVLVENYRPGAADRMGIGYEAVAAVNPDIIYVSISGFGSSGPLAHRRVYDTVIQAQSGLAANQTGPTADQPVFLRQLAADKITALTASQAITAALFARDRGAGGQLVELSMIDACMAFLFVDGAGHQVVRDNTTPDRPEAAVATTTPLTFVDGHAAITPVSDAEYHGLAAAFGVDSSDPLVATIADRMTNPDASREVLRSVHRAAATRTAADGCAAMDAHDVPYGLVLSVAEAAQQPQVLANDLFTEHEHPAMGRIRQTRPVARFSRTAAALREPSCPTLGQHTAEVLTELGHRDRIEQLRATGVLG